LKKCFTTTSIVAAVLTLISTGCWAEEPEKSSRIATVVEDAKLYVTAPMRWDSKDWLYFGGAIVAIRVAHRYDDDTRTHVVAGNPELATDTTSHSVSDALPAAAAFAGTWAYATLINSNSGRTEAWSMIEAAALSTTTSFALKFVAGRERPNVTEDNNSWRAGGDSFPSLHSTAAFAIGAVLAESGNDDDRWIRRILGYGIGVATSYQRIKHNQHWLSDTVAGAALGISTARFVLNRRDGGERNRDANFTVVPADGGVLLTYTVALH
jgi:membrane-associated phospholipid phosphatase